MFNLFKKPQNELPKQKVEVKVKGATYPPEVMAIHHEFATAADRLVAEAKIIIAEASTKDASKVDRLEKLGFKQANQVTELKPLIQKAALSKEQVELVRYYQQNYPQYKFITEEQVKQICFKYNLICGDVSRYKGFVPEKNLKDIESFKVKNASDVEVFLYSYASEFYTEYEARELGYWERNSDEYEGYKSNPDIANKRGRFKIDSAGMRICAPVKDMDLTGMTIAEGYKMIKHIPDPVVLQCVKGGYLILTAWGDEASDELVVNQKMN